MAELKTTRTEASVDKYLETIQDEAKRADCYQLIEIMKEVTKAEPKMWGTAIIGFGDYHYVYESGRQNDWFIMGFSPRKANLTLYSMGGFNQFENLMEQLGKHTTGKGCLYIRKLDDVNTKVLKKLITKSVKEAVKNKK